MSIPIVPVTVTVNDQNAGRGGAKISASLSDYDIYSDFFIVPGVTTTTTTDAAGVAVLNLFPNVLGTRGTHYLFKITLADGRTHSVTAIVPSHPCTLESIAVLN